MASLPPSALPLLGAPAVLAASLRAGRGSARALFAGLGALARQHAALELALAMVLAWLKRQDPADLTYSSFTAFCRERVDWRASWLRELVALVDSPLDLVKRAACAGLVPLRVAVTAPGRVAPEAQAAWLAQVALGPPPAEPKRELLRLEGEAAETVRRARHVARLCLGRAARARAVDDYVLACWRARVPAEQILEDARAAPPAPDHGPPLGWDWYQAEPSVEANVGAWSEPVDIPDALARMDALQAVLRGRRIVLARAWALVITDRTWRRAGFASLEACAGEVLGMSLRNAQRLGRVGRVLLWYPEVDRAVRDGLPLGCADALAGVLCEGAVADWIGVAERVGRLELSRAVEAARHDGGARTVARYRWAIAAADRWDAERAEGATGAGAGATVAGALPGATGAGGAPGATSAGGPPGATGAGGVTGAGGAPGATGAGDAPGPSGPSGPSGAGGAREGSEAPAERGAGAPPERRPPGRGGDARPRVGLRHPTRFTDAPLSAPPDLVEAARWFLATVRIPPRRGFSVVKDRDDDRCGNPECGRRSLRNESHHLQFRSHGGPDTLENGTCACRVCHARGVHARRLWVERVEVEGFAALLWTWPGGRRALVFQEEPRGAGCA